MTDLVPTDRKRELRAQWRARDIGLRSLGLDGYDAYLRSPHWRAMVAALKASRCCRCGSARALALHHITYERVGHESPHDLRTLCAVCHELIHDHARRGLCSLDPATLQVDLGQVVVAKSKSGSAKRKRRRASVMTDAEAGEALGVACPTCKAKIGDVCRVPNGSPRRSHAARRSTPVVEPSREEIIKRAKRSQFPIERMHELRDQGALS